MITKIFKRLSIFSYIVSFFLTLAVNLFDLYSRNAAEIYPGLFQRALTISSGLIIIIVMVSLSATKKINTKFGAEHLLSFPVCLLLFYQDAGLNYQKFFLGIILVIALNIFSKDWSKGNSNKALFSLGCLFTITSFINSYFSIFFISTLLIIIRLNNKRSAIFSLLIGVFMTLQSLAIVTYLLTGKFLYAPPAKFLESIPLNRIINGTELVWIIMVILAFISAFYLKRVKRRGSHFIRFEGGDNFMLFWLVTSVVFRIFNLYVGGGIWLLSFIPTAFFIGKAYKTIKKDAIKEVLVLLLVCFGIVFKLYENGVFIN
ncbi:hypothetical protein N9C47_00105 [Flavobacteriaceae bacterium]|jgi:hypothetical protein|nr:hypothetical protein [Flavobacteriaceae bacterium]